ncbi:hypothetical protein IC620_15980 [Hazenella sp. IB182357]|uniref:Uncharacterized protein n=1 Tax=Polycladospora coralii TaxID=2771432 RepID=A0A926RVQ7_9BACL|nr:hypothetical protein [Polycladospora coralii]MBD1373844.1 hypothetical protein [Polycladospora coralii]
MSRVDRIKNNIDEKRSYADMLKSELKEMRSQKKNISDNLSPEEIDYQIQIANQSKIYHEALKETNEKVDLYQRHLKDVRKQEEKIKKDKSSKQKERETVDSTSETETRYIPIPVPIARKKINWGFHKNFWKCVAISYVTGGMLIILPIAIFFLLILLPFVLFGKAKKIVS